MVRDSKGWRIDRRRSVTRYSCQQAAGIAVPLSHLPFPPLSRPYAPPSLARQPSRSLATDAGLPRNILHVNAASMFSQRRGLSMASSVPGPFLLPPPPPPLPPPVSSSPCPVSRISRSSFHAPSAFYSAILEYCSCYTGAGTDRGQLLDIPRETVLVHRP